MSANTWLLLVRQAFSRGEISTTCPFTGAAVSVRHSPTGTAAPVNGQVVEISPRENACRTSSNQVFALKDVDVYQRLGQGFVSGGVGFRWGIGKHVAAIANLNAQFLLPSTGFTVSPSLGVSAGF